jgi:hypothetical protein
MQVRPGKVGGFLHSNEPHPLSIAVPCQRHMSGSLQPYFIYSRQKTIYFIFDLPIEVTAP